MPLRNVIIVAISIVISLACYSVASKNRYANLFAEAMDLIDTEALREVPRQQLFNSAMSGMLKELDEHSMFITGDMYREFDEDIRQEFGGVGMYVEVNPLTDRLMVLAPMPGTPAYDAGLQVGDEICEIDGTLTTGMERSDAVKLLRGPINEPVELLIERDSQRITKQIVRASIPVPSLYGDFRDADGSVQFLLKEHPRIGYLRLIQFGEKSVEEIEQALGQMEGKVDGLILDLRNNSGGLLAAAVQICDFFLEREKLIVSTRGRNRNQQEISKTAAVVKSNIPLAILINRNSASASEIVAGCLQDHQRAVIIGEQSWGKGTVQNIIPMQRGESALKLTTASYWRPSGRQIDRYDEESQKTKIWGVQPDQGYEIKMTEEEVFDNLRFRSIRDLEGLLPPEENETFDAIKKLRLQAGNGMSSDENETPADQGPIPDDPTDRDVPAPQMDGAEIHVDRPLEKAIEYFKSVLSERQIAA